ncbi:D-2-hydroxyglutarate dehydrogenase, partial [Aphelenchoides avenae]
MSFDEVLSGYVQELHDLPDGIREKLNEIRELDEFVEAKRHELQSRVRSQITARRPQSKELEDIQAEYDDLEQLSRRKFHLANETYELVDQYIIKLDNQTQEFQGDMRRRFSEAYSRLEP